MGLVLGGRTIPEGGVETLAVVEDLDELKDGGPYGCTGGPGVADDQFGLEGGEEVLRDGIVPALA